MSDTLLGIAVIVVGGVCAGLFTLPLSFVKGWQFEHHWLIYTIYGMVLTPWIFELYSLEHLGETYSNSPPRAIALAITFGFLWGIGSVTLGQGVSIVGNALGFAIILGLTSAVGAVLPLVLLHPSDIASRQGIFTWIGLGIVMVGLVLLAKAGRQKEKDQAAPELQHLQSNKSAEEKQQKKSFTFGLVICVVSGLFSPCLNLAIAFGSDIGKNAEKAGNGKMFSDNATWSLAVGAGMIPNVSYCLYLLFKNKNAYLFCTSSRHVSPVRNAALSALGGTMWFSGNVLYTVGGQMVGDLGTVIGWPIFMISMILASNIFGIAKGEWRGASSTAKIQMGAGLVILFAAVVVIALG